MLSPSQSAQYQQLWHAKCHDRLPHALMFTGVKGTQKNAFVDYFSRALLCQKVSEKGVPCDVCHTCRLVVGRTHPDVMWVQPEKSGAAIKVEQVRTVADFIQQTSFEGAKRMVIISPADAMNVNAANALLKTLEEPSSDAYLFLINDQQSRLPATIVSRCQRIAFAEPNKEQQFIAISEDSERTKLFQALVAALDNKADKIKLVADLIKSDSLLILDYLLGFLTDLIKVQLTDDMTHILNRDYADIFARFKSQTSTDANIQLMEHVRKIRSEVSQGFNFNKQLVLESIFSRWGG